MKLICTIILALTFATSCASNQSQNWQILSGRDHNNQKIQHAFNSSKATVVVFLSSICPCSNSNGEVVKRLAKQYPDFAFIGVHSNADEELASARAYFQTQNYQFPVIYDEDSSIAKRLGALKTPHVFILDQKGEVIYNGGVTSSSSADLAEHIYLETALQEITDGKKPSAPLRKTLGCYIKLKS